MFYPSFEIQPKGSLEISHRFIRTGNVQKYFVQCYHSEKIVLEFASVQQHPVSLNRMVRVTETFL